LLFTTPKGLKSLQAFKKNRKDLEKEDIIKRVEQNISVALLLELGKPFVEAVFINLDICKLSHLKKPSQ